MLSAIKHSKSIIIAGSILATLAMQDRLFAYTLHDAVYQTLQNHPDVLSSKADAAAAADDIRIAKGGLYPSLEIAAGIGPEYSDNPATRASSGGSRSFTRRETGAFLQQLLFDGGNVRGNIKQRSFYYDASKHGIAETQERLAFQAVAAYHNILRNLEIVNIRKLDVKSHNELLGKVKRQLEAGIGRKSEISLANARLAASSARLQAAQGELENAYDIFTKIVGQAAPTILQRPDMPKNLPKSETEARNLGLQMNPAIKVTASKAQASNAAIGVAESAFYPKFTLDLSSTYNNNLDGVPGRNDESRAMLRMTYNLLNGGSDLATIHAAKNRKQAAIEEVANIKREVMEGVSLAWNDRQTAKDSLNYLKQHRDESLDVFNAYVKQFQLGQRTLFDLLNAQAEYYDASINYVAGRYDEQVYSYRLLASMGNLVNTLSQGNYAIEKAVASPFSYKIPVAQEKLTPTKAS